MSRRRINQNNYARCLLTEITPYETPIRFSNWGSYNYHTKKDIFASPPFTPLHYLLEAKNDGIPYSYKIAKDNNSLRTLSLAHPKHSADIISLYKEYALVILKACRRSTTSLRRPHHIAKFYIGEKGGNKDLKRIEDITEQTRYASSYFTYSNYSHLYKFFESDEFTELEKAYSNVLYLDIAKCFPSMYTHAISWAIQGKVRGKDKSISRANGKQHPCFDDTFDTLLNSMNWKETHGIIVGPELCRIFAEIILQRIDSEVLTRLDDGDAHPRLGVDYWYARYIDDYFFFFNDESHKKRFEEILGEELEKYKLYINNAKVRCLDRPFISDISITKLELSHFLKEIAEQANSGDLTLRDSSRVINKLRSLIKKDAIDFSDISVFLLSTLQRITAGLKIEDLGKLYDALHVLADITFHSFRMDIRVPTTYRVLSIVINLREKWAVLEQANRMKLLDKIVHELRGALYTALQNGYSLEAMNILSGLAEFYDVNPMSQWDVENIITKLRAKHRCEFTTNPRLTYFEIISLLYYIGDYPVYARVKQDLLQEAKEIVKLLNPYKFSESAHLLLDLVSSPYFDNMAKDSLILEALSHHAPSTPLISDIGRFRNLVSGHTWYFDWDRTSDIKSHLKKKEYALSY